MLTIVGGAKATVVDCRFEGNHTGNCGVAMYLEASESTVTGCLFYRNKGGDETATSVVHGEGADAKASFDKCVFLENSWWKLMNRQDSKQLGFAGHRYWNHKGTEVAEKMPDGSTFEFQLYDEGGKPIQDLEGPGLTETNSLDGAAAAKHDEFANGTKKCGPQADQHPAAAAADDGKDDGDGKPKKKNVLKRPLKG